MISFPLRLRSTDCEKPVARMNLSLCLCRNNVVIEFIRIRDKHRRDHMIFLCDLLQIKFDQKVSRVDMIAVMDLRLKVFSLELNRLKPDVNQQLDARIACERDCMPCVKHIFHSSIKRRVQLSF